MGHVPSTLEPRTVEFHVAKIQKQRSRSERACSRMICEIARYDSYRYCKRKNAFDNEAIISRLSSAIVNHAQARSNTAK